jgi:hypothetical protein
MESKDIKIVRLTSGEDIVCGLIESDGTYYLKNPMVFLLKDTGKQFVLMLQNWLPMQVMKMNEAIIKEKDVIAVLQPDENFIEYFLNESKEMEEAIEAKLNLRKLENLDSSEPGMNDWINQLEDMEISKGELIH